MILHNFLNIVVFIITLGILIIVHEYGHFLAARFFKVKVDQFSIGFGPVLWSWYSKRGTRYVISAVLIGGYVKFVDKKAEHINSNFHFDDSLCSKSIWKRGIIVVAGPVFNFIFSILLYTLIFIIGTPICKPIINYILPNSIMDQHEVSIGSEIESVNNVKVNDWESLRSNIYNNFDKKKIIIIINLFKEDKMDHKGYVVYLSNDWLHQSMINTIDPATALGIFPNVVYVESIVTKKEQLFFDKQADLKIGDKILLINSKPIYDWKSFVQMFKNYSEKTFSMTIERDKHLLFLHCKLYKKNFVDFTDKYKNIDLFLNTLVIKIIQVSEIQRCGFFSAIIKSFYKTWHLICFIVNALVQLFLGNIKIDNLHGPIAIAKEASQAASFGFLYYLAFLAIISINLGIINLLPLPILDGGQILFLLLEKLKGNSISQKTQNFVYVISLIILMLITLIALYNDIMKW